jgi:hypothetical protein
MLYPQETTSLLLQDCGKLLEPKDFSISLSLSGLKDLSQRAVMMLHHSDPPSIENCYTACIWLTPLVATSYNPLQHSEMALLPPDGFFQCLNMQECKSWATSAPNRTPLMDTHCSRVPPLSRSRPSLNSAAVRLLTPILLCSLLPFHHSDLSCCLTPSAFTLFYLSGLSPNKSLKLLILSKHHISRGPALTHICRKILLISKHYVNLKNLKFKKFYKLHCLSFLYLFLH